MVPISINSQIQLHKKLGFMWSGWMGGQWAFTPEILPYIEGRDLTVICGGPGDLCMNALLMGVTQCAVNVDASEGATVYGDTLFSARQRRDSLSANVISDHIEGYNKSERGVPNELKTPFLSETPIDTGTLTFVQADGLSYLEECSVHNLQGTTFWYLATPTVLPLGVLEGGKKHFYQVYDPNIRIRVDWADPVQEWSYIRAMMEQIRRIDPHARVGFGVGEGDTTLQQYVEMLGEFGNTSLVLEKTFDGDGYQFTDWLIMCDLNGESK